MLPNAALLPQHPSASYKLEFEVPNHHFQASSDTSTGFVHLFHTPDEVAEEELKDIEMNKTIHSLDVHGGDEGAAAEERKSVKSLGYAKGKDDRKADSLNKEQVIQTLGETGMNDMKELQRSNYPQQLVDDQLDSASFVSPVPKEITNDDDMTVDKLYEEFYCGKISLEDFHHRIIRIPKEDVKEDSLPEVKKKNIEALEQQVFEVAQSLSESQHLVSRVRLLMEDTETAEIDKDAAQTQRSRKKFSGNSSRRDHDNVTNSSRDNAQWQEALSLYRKQGKKEPVIQFLDAANFENITCDMVDEIIECENNIQSKEVQKTSETMKTTESTSLHLKRIHNSNFGTDKKQLTVRGDGLFKSDGANYQDSAQEETYQSSELINTEECQKSLSSDTRLSELHLDLACMR